EVLYPGYFRRQNLHIGNVEYHAGDLIDGLHDKLTHQVARALRHEAECGRGNAECGMKDENSEVRTPHSALDLEALAQQKAVEFLRRLPDIRLQLEQDVRAAFEGDPAAKSYHEVIFCYPGLEAVSVYRVAHELLLVGVPLIPRMMTEHAHA